MAIQEWFYLHPWAKILYWIIGITLLFIIYKLPTVYYPSQKMIVRPPFHWADSFESKQGLRSREEYE